MEPFFTIGKFPIRGRLLLAPMDGFSDQPFRWLCRKMGSSITYSEFINVMDVPARLNDLDRRIAFSEYERPLGFQLYGIDPAKILTAAQILQEKNPDFIDLNLGCSVRRVAGRGAGAGLLKKPRLIGEIISTLKKHLQIPITAKIRLGWDANNLNYMEIAHILEESGASLIAVHARTKDQSWKEPVNWYAIKQIKDSVSIPIIGNGDVSSATEARHMISETNCDAAMIGRAAIGNPWIFKEIEKKNLTRDQILHVVKLHWDLMVAFYGAEKAKVLFKKHLKAYLSTPQFADVNLQEILSAPNTMNNGLFYS